MKLQKEESYMNLWMDPLGDPLTTRLSQTIWVIPIEPYPCWRYRFIDNLDCQFGNGPVLTLTRTRSDGPELLLTLGVKFSSLEAWAASLIPGGEDGVPGRGSGGCNGGAPIPFCLQCICRFFPVILWQARQPSVWVSLTIACCPSIAAFNFLGPGNWTPHLVSSWTLVWGMWMRYWVFSIVTCKNPPLYILAIFEARHMLDCSSCTRHPCLVIVAGRLKTYPKLVTDSKYDIRVLHL